MRLAKAGNCWRRSFVSRRVRAGGDTSRKSVRRGRGVRFPMVDASRTLLGSMAGSDDDVLESALDWIVEGRRVAVATVVDTWGSSPRPRGSQLVVRDDGLFLGSVSGGCVEGKVVEAAQTAMEDRRHR